MGRKSRREIRIQNETLEAAASAAAEDAAEQVDGVALRKVTLTVGHADLTNAVNGGTQEFSFDALPTNAVVVGYDFPSFTVFSGGSISTLSVDVGTAADPDAVINAIDLAGAMTEQKRRESNGVRPFGTYSAAALKLLFTPDGGHNLNALDAGTVTVDIFFMVP